MQAFVFAKKLLADNITNVQCNSENTGILGIFPNKVVVFDCIVYCVCNCFSFVRAVF